MTVKDQIVKEIEHLSESDLRKIAEYLSFLRCRSRLRKQLHIADEENLAELYGQFANEDPKLAEEGFDEYSNNLKSEDE
ncbi:MAG: hypothetical protein Q9P14_17300 [candidate division KSB1 bacterium]|nr:hypothetical protein [candidate division KSB1 bacterium]MDQ7064162.1 hypothetical protein [candidate division KSB1 bacterium]